MRVQLHPPSKLNPLILIRIVNYRVSQLRKNIYLKDAVKNEYKFK